MERSIATKVLVREVMNSPVISGSENETADQLAKKMVKYSIGSVIIIDGEDVKGIVTDRDLVNKVVAKNLHPSEVKAKDVMSSPLQTIESEKDVTDAARLMRKLGVKRLGVTYKGKVVGIVSMSDIIGVTPEIIDIISEKARILSGGSGQRASSVSGYCDNCNQWSDNLLEIDGKFICEECRIDQSRRDDEETA